MVRVIRLLTVGALYVVAEKLLNAATSSIARDKVLAYTVFRFYGKAAEKVADWINPLDIEQAQWQQYPAPNSNEVHAIVARWDDLGGNKWMLVVRSGLVVRQCTVDGDLDSVKERAKELAVEISDCSVQ